MNPIFSLPSLSALSLSLLLVFCSSCAKEDLLDDSQQSRPELQAAEGSGEEDSDPCDGLISYELGYTILPAAGFPGYDLAVFASSALPETLGEDCECVERKFCITFDFPIVAVDDAAFTKQVQSQSPIVLVQKDGLGGYVNHNDPRGRAPGSTEHVICGTQEEDLIFLFDLDYAFPPGFDIMDAITDVEGICIVDNVADPNGGN